MEQLLRDDVVLKFFFTILKLLHQKYILIIIGRLATHSSTKIKKKYNGIFIDADHSYDAVIKDIKNSLDLIEENGIICGDDLNLQMHQVNADNAKVNRNKDLFETLFQVKISSRGYYSS